MSQFTDPIAAVEEAEFLAAATSAAHAVVDAKGGILEVMPEDEAKEQGRRILEVCRAT